ncbi:MAG: ABC1 kinase family protein [Sandaracinaceae bacterium]
MTMAHQSTAEDGAAQAGAAPYTDDVPLAEVRPWQAFLRALRVSTVLCGAVLLGLCDRVGLRWVAFLLTGRSDRYARLTGPVLARRAFERLGPTYVKLGQLVASGEALFPARYSEAFRTLLDRVPSFPFSEVEQVVQEDLGAAALAGFDSIDPEPLAAASIAQVHTARLVDGAEVVVKVQRPGIAALAATDIALMRGVARVLMRVSVHARRANVLAVIEDFEANLREELDFTNEAGRMREFNEVMRAMGTDSVAAPVMHDALSGTRVLTMERFDGWRLDDTEAVTGSGYDMKERLLTGIRAWFQTLIVRGFFHGDVHAGNFLLLKDGRIGYLDFGIVGRFSEAQRANVLEYVLGFQSRDFDRVARSMIGMGTMEDAERVDLTTFAADLGAAYAPMMDPVDGFQMKDLVPQLLRVSRKHALRMPRELVLVTKQLVYLDRYSRAYGGAKMNVLTDHQLKNYIMQDMLAAMMAG